MRVVRATVQPPLTSPRRWESGTRTSVKKTSLNEAPPVIWRSGRTSTPGACMSTTNPVRPLCLGASGSVRQMISPMSENCAPEVHTFWPVTIHSSPSRTARVWSPARSLPAPGSLNSWQADDVAAPHRPQVALLHLVGGVGQDRRRHHAEADAEGGHGRRVEAGLEPVVEPLVGRGAARRPPSDSGPVIQPKPASKRSWAHARAAASSARSSSGVRSGRTDTSSDPSPQACVDLDPGLGVGLQERQRLTLEVRFGDLCRHGATPSCSRCRAGHGAGHGRLSVPRGPKRPPNPPGRIARPGRCGRKEVMAYVLAVLAAFANATTTILQRMGVETAPAETTMRLSLLAYARAPDGVAGRASRVMIGGLHPAGLRPALRAAHHGPAHPDLGAALPGGHLVDLVPPAPDLAGVGGRVRGGRRAGPVPGRRRPRRRQRAPPTWGLGICRSP